ncbi:MAG: hypothetical protein CML60_09945 [Rhodobacteraceae bacterium]|nr:hypothetical protein [Paracoccaceae bacterium]
MVTEERLWSDTGYFTIIPEWVLDAKISDGAVRLYGILGRYSDAEDKCFPSRATLASRMQATTKSVDRRIAELVAIGALSVEHRLADSPAGNKFHRSNIYHLKRINPQGVGTQLSLGGDSNVSRVETPVSQGRDTTVALNQSQERKPIESDLLSEKEDAYILCEALVEAISADGTTEPKITKRWIIEMDRLLRIDQQPVDVVHEMIQWSAADDFWCTNILSPQKLRKHFPRLVKQKQREKGSSKTSRLLSVLDD